MQKKLLHKKTWGWERWFANNELYCGKLIMVQDGEWSSKGRYHYHKIKDETFFVIEGILRLDYYDENNEHQILRLPKYGSFRVPPGMKHRFTSISLGCCKFIEASTTHMEEDSYRCEWDEKKGEWVEY